MGLVYSKVIVGLHLKLSDLTGRRFHALLNRMYSLHGIVNLRYYQMDITQLLGYSTSFIIFIRAETSVRIKI